MALQISGQTATKIVATKEIPWHCTGEVDNEDMKGLVVSQKDKKKDRKGLKSTKGEEDGQPNTKKIRNTKENEGTPSAVKKKRKA